MKIYFFQFKHLLYVNLDIKKLSGPQQKGDLSIIRISLVGCVPERCRRYWNRIGGFGGFLSLINVLLTQSYCFERFFKKVLKLIRKSTFLVLIIICNNHIYYSSGLWKRLLCHSHRQLFLLPLLQVSRQTFSLMELGNVTECQNLEG